MTNLKIKSTQCTITALKTPELSSDQELQNWLIDQATQYELKQLLGHADDGVIWGKFQDKELYTTHQVCDIDISPPLRPTTLQQVRIFGENAELLIWREDENWKTRLLVEGQSGEITEYYDEDQILWGNTYEETCDGFTLVCEGQQGLRHAPPIIIPRDCFGKNHWPLRLCVRHYLHTDDETGILKITLSRLIKVTYEKQR